MATYTGFLAGGTKGHSSSGREPYLVESVVDFSKVTSTLAANDIFKMINVPAETLILAVGMEVITAVGGTGTITFSLGDSGSATRWGSGLSGGTVGYVAFTDAVSLKTSADDVRLTVTGTNPVPTSGVLRVFALMVDTSGVTEAAHTATPDATA